MMLEVPDLGYPTQSDSMKEFWEYLKSERQTVYGWICGKCGRSNAPNVSQCPCYYGPHPNPWPPSTTPNYPTTTPQWYFTCGGQGTATQNEGIHRFPNQN